MKTTTIDTNSWLLDPCTTSTFFAHKLTKTIFSKRTAYQEMQIVETEDYGKSLILDEQLQSSVVDEFIYHESLVQPAMINHGSPRQVLILGGGEGATLREVLRWKTVERLVMVDIDGEVVAACREHLPEMHQNAFDDPRLELVIGDALHVLDTSSQEWDIIISDLSDPIEEGPSFQLFTQEYFQKIRRVLKPDGFFIVQAGPVAPAEITLHARLVYTVNSVFPNVLSYASHVPTYAAPWGFALGSAQPIPSRPSPEEIDQLLAQKTTGGFQLIDGITLLGMLQTPAYIRRAIAEQTQVYTLKEPPKFFGKGANTQ
ncbi:MAG: methyltransferase domain-containing protein [Moorea sp. SIO4A1]|uniref:fused MFS/spermidine synthase n=1 Tax=Moorena sp. SIO4A1 TaxID=2607835 RepID=UPI00144E7871|nr:fused MFS/spermidine synthase [Moorena sp. SIO4A1]NEQ63193.1 methyltransferase domain-containing protein [Moorena sp. SIO4A1]